MDDDNISSISVKKERINDEEEEKDDNLNIITPQPKKRGRRPKVKVETDNTEKPPNIKLDKDGNEIPKKPRKPRRKELPGSRKKYRKRISSKNNSMQTTSYGDNVANVPIKSEKVKEMTGEEAQQTPDDIPLIETFKSETKKNEDINSLLFSNLFNKRIISDMTVVDSAAAHIFRILDEKLSEEKEDSPNHKLFKLLEEKFKIVYNKTSSLEKTLGPFCINLMRGYMSSKMSPIPLQRPWNIRTEVMDNDSKTWTDLQNAVNEYYIHIQKEREIEEKTDEELLSQKASSFFLGKSVDNNSIPSYLYNSDWLISATESRGPSEHVLVGGGDAGSSSHRTHTIHTVVSSFRGDLNAGLELPDLPLQALKIMGIDKQEMDINSHKNLPVSDPQKYV